MKAVVAYGISERPRRYKSHKYYIILFQYMNTMSIPHQGEDALDVILLNKKFFDVVIIDQTLSSNEHALLGHQVDSDRY